MKNIIKYIQLHKVNFIKYTILAIFVLTCVVTLFILEKNHNSNQNNINDSSSINSKSEYTEKLEMYKNINKLFNGYTVNEVADEFYNLYFKSMNSNSWYELSNYSTKSKITIDIYYYDHQSQITINSEPVMKENILLLKTSGYVTNDYFYVLIDDQGISFGTSLINQRNDNFNHIKSFEYEMEDFKKPEYNNFQDKDKIITEITENTISEVKSCFEYGYSKAEIFISDFDNTPLPNGTINYSEVLVVFDDSEVYTATIRPNTSILINSYINPFDLSQTYISKDINDIMSRYKQTSIYNEIIYKG